MTTHFPAEIPARLRELAEKWQDQQANERASLQTYVLELCAALGVEPPSPPTPNYQFERDVQVTERDGSLTTNFIDLWKADHFALEGKALLEAGAETRDRRLRRAFGQVRTYVAHVSGTPPPFLVVLDVARTLIVWDRWSGRYGDYQAGRVIPLPKLHERPDDIALLRDMWMAPAERDPRAKAQAVTQDLAGQLARFAAALEDRGHDGEKVARFVMRCVFCCFAEDVGLLRANLFRQTLEAAARKGDPSEFADALTTLWRTMDTGGRFGAEILNRFNGHFFKTVEALPLDKTDMALLIEASKADWSQVEPTIFGTLLVRALDPEERHRLGAEYTPRTYIERLVRPTVEEPIRERWTAVQADVLQLEEAAGVPDGKKPTAAQKKQLDAAMARLRDFHAWMRGLHFLDPACGSGNFLYVTMDIVKHIELEVLREIARLSGGQESAVLDEVHPRQFHGIEIKPWAREIAELTLWIGYHQWWRETHGGRTPPDPILEDTGTIECRDAVLAWDSTRHDPSRDRPDPTPRIKHPVTGELVPDPAARIPYFERVNPRVASWPTADFVIGNPPYLGQSRQRAVLDDGYVDALRNAYPDLPDTADFVLYWWQRAALLVAAGELGAAGLITTNSIAQGQNRLAIELAIARGASIVWVCANHPWVGDGDAAAVRVAMTVVTRGASRAALVHVDDDGLVVSQQYVARIHSDLTGFADVATASRLVLWANADLAHDGVKLHGRGFQISPVEAADLLKSDGSHAAVLRPLRNGRDIAARPRGVYAIDFGLMTESEARAYPVLFDVVRDRVLPTRLANRSESYARYWWRFGRPRPEWRVASAGLARFIATVDTSPHRYFVFLDDTVLADDGLVQVASDDAYVLGVLSSLIHRTWSIASGGRLGVGDDPRWNKSTCFDPYPFPAAGLKLTASIRDVATRLDAHRTAALARDERVTMTGMYNVVEKLRSGAALTPKERSIHEIAACGVLKDLHDELDVLVAQAYGWPWPMQREEILERLVALHDERVAEEQRGLVRWLRPDYQIPRFGKDLAAAPAEFDLPAFVPASPTLQPAKWAPTAVEQLTTITALLAERPRTSADLVASFSGARPQLIERHLETLALMGEVTRTPTGQFALAQRVG